MRVVVNRLAMLGPKTGIGHYTAELLRGLRAQAGPDQLDCFPAGWVWSVRRVGARLRPAGHYRAEAGPQTTADKVQGGASLLSPAALLRLGRRQVLDALGSAGRALMQRHLRAVFLDRPCDLYHEPNIVPLPCDRPMVVTLHDLSVLLRPDWHSAERVAEYERHFPRALAASAHFLTDTEFTRREAVRLLGIPPQRLTRVYLGIRRGLVPPAEQEIAAVRRRLGLPPEYLLYVGTIEPRKNLGTLLRAYCALPGPVRSRVPLLLAGCWGWKADGLAEFYHAEARHRGVRHLGYVADRDLPALYTGARALVYPSYYEGFGLPPLEMFACGGPVLASTAGALVETLGGRAHHIEPDDLDGWHRGLRRVIEDDDWRAELRAGVVEVARPFTWERCAAETWRVYRHLGRASSPRAA